MTKLLADTNVFIAIFKGDLKLKSFVESELPSINTIVYLELIQGAKNKNEVRKIEEYLTRFELIHFDSIISWHSIHLVREYSKSHGLMLPDAVIAATCLENELSLLTFNIQDFSFINGLDIAKIAL
jgi:predicted nucleic acid-binding protein